MLRRLNQLIILSLLSSLLVPTFASAQDSVWGAKKSGWQLLTDSQRKEVFDFAESYKAYLRIAKTAYTSTKEFLRLAKASGFTEFTDASQVKPGARLIFNSHDRALVLAVVGSDPMLN